MVYDYTAQITEARVRITPKKAIDAFENQSQSTFQASKIYGIPFAMVYKKGN